MIYEIAAICSVISIVLALIALGMNISISRELMMSKEMKVERSQNRERGTGRYTYDGDDDRLCVCGHALAYHAAARVKIDGQMFQDCMVGMGVTNDPTPDELCPSNCQLFKPAKNKR